MKKITSLLLTLILLVTSMFTALVPAVSATADTTSADALTASLGGNDGNLLYVNNFNNDGEVPFTVNSGYVGGVETNQVVDGKWSVNADMSSQWKTIAFNEGWSQNSLGDFIATFEFCSKQGYGQSSFYYHSKSGLNNSYAYRLFIKTGAGYTSTITLQNADNTETCSVSGPVTLVNGKFITFNVVIISKGSIDAAYVWEKGTPIPSQPTVQITTANKTNGDFYYLNYKDKVDIDNIKIYDLTAVSPENMQTATGVALDEKTPFYINDFDNNFIAPPNMYSAYITSPFYGTNVVSNGKWVLGGEGGYNGLTGKNDLGDFAIGYQFSVNDNDDKDGFSGWLAYNSFTGWGDNKTLFSRFKYWKTSNGIGFSLNAQPDISSANNANIECSNNETLNIVLIKVNLVISAYIWKLGENIPTTPVLTVTATAESSGDLYFHTAGATTTFDNFFVYDLTDTALYPEQIEKATGIDLESDMLVYRSDFDAATEPPTKVFDRYFEDDFSGISKIENGKWVTGGTIGTSTGLTGLPYLKNFAYAFQYKMTDATDGYFATFAYHSTSGWKGVNPENRLQMGKSDGKIYFELFANDGADDTAVLNTSVLTDYAVGDLMNVIMTYVDGKVSAYIWKAGESVPTVPTLTLEAQKATYGDLYLTLSKATFTFEDIYVYDLTSDDSDGVYTTMESSYRMERTFKGLPKTIETTIKMPKIFTGGKGNTIIGNHKYKDYVFSFEINENGNPYIIFDPPWKQKRVLEFTDVDIRTGEWLHLAITTDIAADTVSCYINGELKQTLAIPTHYDPVLEQNTDFHDYDIGDPLYVGRDIRGGYDGYYFKGKIKTLTLFSDIRTDAEIAADMNGVDTTEETLIADYCFDGCYGTDVADRSKNALNLKNVGYMQTAPEEPTDYAYSFAIVGDTQILTRVFPEKLSCIYDWIVDNKQARNIQYVMGVGDITDSDTDREWELAKSEISKLNGVVPYSLVRGNHDSAQKFSSYLTDIYSSQIDGCYNGDINSSYRIFTVGEVDYLSIALNMGAIDEELLWAEELIKTHPNHNVIITTHIYLDSDGTHIDDYGTGPATSYHKDANNGDDMWNELISRYSNISLVLCGHVYSTDVVVTKSQGVNGNIVTQILSDPQGTDESYSAGPTGIVTMLYFSEDGKTVQVRNYSTIRDEYFGAQNQFTMEIDTVDYLYGDANDDATVDIRDLIRVKRTLAQPETKHNPRTADFNRDNKLDGYDLKDLKKKLLNVG